MRATSGGDLRGPGVNGSRNVSPRVFLVVEDLERSFLPADHLDEIGHLFGDAPGTSNAFRHLVFWKDLVREVRARGF